MNPLNFYTHPDKLDYEKEVDPVGRDLIKQINQTDYLRTTMYCSGHFEDEDPWPWCHKMLHLDLVVINQKICEAAIKLEECRSKFYNTFGYGKVRGFTPNVYIDQDNNNEIHYLSELIVEYETKEDRQKVIDILKEILV
jgi:hypothetical protein